MGTDVTVYEIVGGAPFFTSLSAAFYARVETSAVLRPLYPDDLTEARDALAGFLAQYFGGPPEYSASRGHPRLRMRHVHLRIGPAERDAWYGAMAEALDATLPAALAATLAATPGATPAGHTGSGPIDGSGLGDAVRSAMLEYFARSADWMMNAE